MVWGLFLSWGRPTPEQQKACIAKSGGFNYNPEFFCASSSSQSRTHNQESQEEESRLSRNGFFINRARVLLGSGPTTFHLAKSALLSWRHFGLGWAFVDPNTPVETGARFCVCVKELLPWVMMPLQVAYVTDSTATAAAAAAAQIKGSFGFGSGTLQGHLLAGEERFSIEWDKNDHVWYEIFSFSKPAHLLSVIGYPYVQLRQRLFAQQSTQTVLKHVTAKQSTAQSSL